MIWRLKGISGIGGIGVGCDDAGMTVTQAAIAASVIRPQVGDMAIASERETLGARMGLTSLSGTWLALTRNCAADRENRAMHRCELCHTLRPDRRTLAAGVGASSILFHCGGDRAAWLVAMRPWPRGAAEQRQSFDRHRAQPSQCRQATCAMATRGNRPIRQVAQEMPEPPALLATPPPAAIAAQRSPDATQASPVEAGGGTGRADRWRPIERQGNAGGGPTVGDGSPGGSGYARVSVFGVEGKGSKFVYVFDRSASMEGRAAGRGEAATAREPAIARQRPSIPHHLFQHEDAVVRLRGRRPANRVRHRPQQAAGGQFRRRHHGRRRHRPDGRAARGDRIFARRDLLSDRRRRPDVGQRTGRDRAS